MTKARHELGALRLFLMATAAVVPAIILAPAAQAQSAATQFDIPAGPLSPALAAFARQADIEMAYDAGLTRGVSTRGLRGRYGASEGLSRLLSGTGGT
ncbi:STN domain-containing protein [Brevundimonas sp. EAKA]|uniref:STN domain-containing protein n=1 Tax=Brevundimonas sp. EAKA TaxID=1495854 RepID=UPI0018CC3EA3|nr:STN domain-containing protein [Brevundimonas sp. EAKA]